MQPARMGHGLLACTAGMATSTARVAAAQAQAGVRLRGVVFDMDGTLTVPCIDFAEMRRRVGVTGPQDILHEIDSWEEDRKMRAYETLGEIEREAKENLRIMPGAVELCRFLDSKGVRRGLITRNVKDSVDHFHKNFTADAFHPALSREFRPYKPSPQPLLHICAHWGLPPTEVLMVGDSAKDDVVCGNSAGALTCLLDEHSRYASAEDLPESQRPTFLVSTLVQVMELLQSPAFVLEGEQASAT